MNNLTLYLRHFLHVAYASSNTKWQTKPALHAIIFLFLINSFLPKWLDLVKNSCITWADPTDANTLKDIKANSNPHQAIITLWTGWFSFIWGKNRSQWTAHHLVAWRDPWLKSLGTLLKLKPVGITISHQTCLILWLESGQIWTRFCFLVEIW